MDPTADQFVKRYTMQASLARKRSEPSLPEGYCWTPWSHDLINAHAEVTYRSFRGMVDTSIFPCLLDRAGCLRLLREIAAHERFLPQATWLVGGPRGYAASIQGVMEEQFAGAIQNVGVVPEARRLGIGWAILTKCLIGFREMGLRSAVLEVCAENVAALRLYRRLGFKRTGTLYRPRLA